MQFSYIITTDNEYPSIKYTFSFYNYFITHAASPPPSFVNPNPFSILIEILER